MEGEGQEGGQEGTPSVSQQKHDMRFLSLVFTISQKMKGFEDDIHKLKNRVSYASDVLLLAVLE